VTDELELRGYQNDLINFIIESLKNSNSVSIESPTGSGKTIIALTAAIKIAKSTGKKIVYLTRTNSQQEQIISELRKIPEKLRMKAVPMQGRQNLCLLSRDLETDDNFSPESLSRFCNDRKKKVMSGLKSACEYFNDNVFSDQISNVIFTTIPTAEEFLSYGIKHNVCPYEALKFNASKADIVISPYSYFLNPEVAERFLSRWGVSREDLIIILDEAHNLPDIARSASSFSITLNMINLAEKEAHEFGDTELVKRIKPTDFCEMLRNALLDMQRDFLNERDEAKIKFSDLSDYVAIGNKMNPDTFWYLSSLFTDFGENILDHKEKDGKVPRSHVYTLGSRLLNWKLMEDEKYIAILSFKDTVKIEAFCIEPTAILEPLMKSKTIHMSGTLEPFEVYSKITGFTNMRSMAIRNVFPLNNRRVFYYDSVSTKYEELDALETQKIHDILENLINGLKKKTIVFFTSYNVMQRITSMKFNFEYISESREMRQDALMSTIQRFRNGQEPLFAVMGGRISEGMNFPGEQLQLVIMVGLPYPKPDAKQKSLYSYYEHKYGNGWLYSVTFPTAIKIRQTLGRLIRGENDVGASVILDRRASYFRRYVPDMMLSRDPLKDIQSFFDSVSSEYQKENSYM